MAFGQMAHYTPFPGASLALPALPQATLNMAFGHHKSAQQSKAIYTTTSRRPYLWLET